MSLVTSVAEEIFYGSLEFTNSLMNEFTPDFLGKPTDKKQKYLYDVFYII